MKAIDVLRLMAGSEAGGTTSVDIGDNVAYSLMLDSGSSQYLSRTQTTSGTWTLSCWAKRGKLSAAMGVLEGAGFLFNAGDTITAGALTTTAVYRDTAGWYHIHISNNGLYVNGVLLGAVTTGVLTNPDIGRNSTSYFDGYLADFIFLDNDTVAYTSFGRTSADTGAWVHKTYSGSYTAGSYHLDFANSADLGNDVSGNNNDWTTNGGISSANQYIDTPTNNFCVLNRLLPSSQTNTPTLTLGNTKMAGGGANRNGLFGSLPIPTTGKWYWELKNNTLTNGTTSIRALAIADLQSRSLTSAIYSAAGFYGWQFQDHRYLCNNGSNTTTASALADGAYAQIAVDCDNGKVYLGIANTWYSAVNTTTTAPDAGGTQTFTLNAGGYFPVAQNYNTTGSGEYNFGAGGSGTTYDSASGGYFKYTPPSGFKALSTANLTAPAIIDPSEHFAVKTRSGTSATATVTGLNFQPDMGWFRDRAGAHWHQQDILRNPSGVKNKELTSSNAVAEGSTTSCAWTPTSDGYTFSDGSSTWNPNTTGSNYIDYLWKANGAGVSNTSGSITSSVSANTTAGISIVSWTGTGANGTIGHGLSTAPKLVIVKNRSTVNSFTVWHTGLTSGAYYLNLDTTAAQASDATRWNSTTPTSSVFSVGTHDATNKLSSNMIAWVFSEIEGYSKIGTYTGNGSADGAFVYCGFKPKMILYKRLGGIGGWPIRDTARSTYNVDSNWIKVNLNTAETTGDANTYIDVVSNGFKARTSDTDTNGSDTYAFIAFAELPMKYSTAR